MHQQAQEGDHADGAITGLRLNCLWKRHGNTMSYEIFHADCFDWLRDQPGNSIHGVLTDPPYGLIEFSRQALDKLRGGN